MAALRSHTFLESKMSIQSDGASGALIDEVDRFVVRLPDDASFHSMPVFVPVAFDRQADGRTTPVLLGGVGERLRYLAQYEVFYALCGDRAQSCVDAVVVCGGQRIEPEKYLALWRQALVQAQPAAVLTQRYGLSLSAVLEGVVAKLRGRRTSWSSSPFERFDEFERKYRNQLVGLADDRFRVSLDLTVKGCARDAFYGDSFLWGADDTTGMGSRLELSLQPGAAWSLTPPPSQTALFADVEVCDVVPA